MLLFQFPVFTTIFSPCMSCVYQSEHYYIFVSRIIIAKQRKRTHLFICLAFYLLRTLWRHVYSVCRTKRHAPIMDFPGWRTTTSQLLRFVRAIEHGVPKKLDIPLSISQTCRHFNPSNTGEIRKQWPSYGIAEISREMHSRDLKNNSLSCKIHRTIASYEQHPCGFCMVNHDG